MRPEVSNRALTEKETMPGRTRRERIIKRLREEPTALASLAVELDASTEAVLEDLRHVAHSLPDHERFLVAPPSCTECGFDGFDEPLNQPSRCPRCRGTDLEDPAFRIERTNTEPSE